VLAATSTSALGSLPSSSSSSRGTILRGEGEWLSVLECQQPPPITRSGLACHLLLPPPQQHWGCSRILRGVGFGVDWLGARHETAVGSEGRRGWGTLDHGTTRWASLTMALHRSIQHQKSSGNPHQRDRVLHDIFSPFFLLAPGRGFRGYMGYPAHKKQPPPPLRPLKGPRHIPTVVPRGAVFLMSEAPL
jgi:hypothetical protein